MLLKSFQDWKSPSPFARLEAKPREMAAFNKDIQVPDKANAYFIALEPVQLTTKDSTYPAFLLGNYMLGGGFLNSRLASRIRQKEGISYGIGAQVSLDYFDKNAGMFLSYAIYAPQNKERLETAYREEIQKVLTDGFNDQEVAEAKSGLLQSRKVSIAQDNNLASLLNSYSYYGETIKWWKEQNDRLSQLTTAQINNIVKKYLFPDNISIVKAGDFSPKKPN